MGNWRDGGGSGLPEISALTDGVSIQTGDQIPVLRTGALNRRVAADRFETGVTIQGAYTLTAPALKVTKGVGAISVLDLHTDQSGFAFRVFQPFDESNERPTIYIDNGGFLNMRSAMTISGNTTGTGATYLVSTPSADPYMLGVWSDVAGPAVQIRPTLAVNGGYNVSLLDSSGNHRLHIEGDGSFTWSATTRAAIDVGVSRIAAGVLEVNSGTIGTRRDVSLQRLSAYGTGVGDGDEVLINANNGGVTFKSLNSSAQGSIRLLNSSGTIKWLCGANLRTGDGQFEISEDAAARFVVKPGGNVGIGQTDPTAALHLKAGTAAAGTAPLKLTSGTNLTTLENGALEYDGTNLYFTTGGVRKTVTLV